MVNVYHCISKWKALERHERKELSQKVMQSGYGVAAVIVGALGISGLGIAHGDTERFITGALGGVIACLIIIYGLYQKACK